MNKNKSLNKNNAIVGNDSGTILYKQENNSLYFSEKVKNILTGNTRRFSHVLRWLYELREKTGAEINIEIKNSFERLVYMYEETTILDEEIFKTPNFGSGFQINKETTSNTLIINRIRDIVFDEIYIDKVIDFSNNLVIRLEYSEDNKVWNTYKDYTIDDVEEIVATEEFQLGYLNYDHGRNTFHGETVNCEAPILRNSPNIFITSSYHETEDGSIQYIKVTDKNGKVVGSAGRNYQVINYEPPLSLATGFKVTPNYKMDDLRLWCTGYIKDPLKTGSDVVRRKRVANHNSGENYSYYYEGKTLPLRYAFRCDKKIETSTGKLYVRYKIIGNGTISTDGQQTLVISGYGRKITNEYYETVVDEDKDVYITSGTNDTLTCSRDLLHQENFYDTKNVIKNRSQTLTINLNLGIGVKTQIYKEMFSDNFISDIKLLEAPEEKFLFFEKDDSVIPSINVPSKIKQLLYKKEDHYINKKIIKADTNFAIFGYEILDGITKYDKDCHDLGRAVTDDLTKIKFHVSKENTFDELTIENPIECSIKDVNDKIIFTGEINLRNNTSLDESTIINNIKTKKTFYKGTIILYSSINDTMKGLVRALGSGNTTPQDVFLVCTNSNDSNIEHCHFNKNSLGKNVFEQQIVKALENRIGLQSNSIEEILNLIDEHITSSIATDRNITLNNMVGFNIYNFTDSSVESDITNRYGYYVNNVVENFELNNDFKLIGTSESNTVEDFIQYDVGTPFNSEIDFSDTGIISTEAQVEDDDNGLSFTINHFNNIAWQYIVGEEEVVLTKNEELKRKYIIAINEENQFKFKTNYNFSDDDVGSHSAVVSIKDKNAITRSYIMDFVVDYKEAKPNKLEFITTNEIQEVGYKGNKEITYSKDTFFQIGINLDGEYNFDLSKYKVVIRNKNNPEYKVERYLTGKWQSKILTIHFDDLKETGADNKKIRFGTWICEFVRDKYEHPIAKTELNITVDINSEANFLATPVETDIDDINNDGLQQGKDVYINLKFNKSEKLTKLRDFIYFCKEVRFLSNSVNFTKEPDNFTFLDINSLNSITGHETSDNINLKTSLRWFISGRDENSSNSFLKPIANLAGDSKRAKNIKLQFLMWDDTLMETLPVQIGTEGITSTPIVCGSEQHYQKLLRIEAKTLDKSVDDLTEEEKEKVKNKLASLGKFNYDKQQTINHNKIFVFYSNLIEIQFDFGNAEFFSITDSNTPADMIPVTKDGKIRYVLNEDTIDENGKGKISVRGFIELTDGTVLTSDETVVEFCRKRKPSIVETGDDYTKYVQYEIDEENSDYYNLKTVIQSKIVLENLDNTYSSKQISHITADLVDVDKRTVIAIGPKVQFYDGFVPQRFVFDTGLTSDDLANISDDDRIEIEETKNYKELEKILNEKIFSNGKFEGQTFYLRFKAVEVAKNYYGENIEIIGQETFYPIYFIEKLKELVIIPASGVIVQNDGYEEKYYTYKNKVSFVLESNNAEYFMYRTDRSASFQKVYPKQIGYTKMLKLTMSTYDVGNHVLEVKQKAEGETESNVYDIIVEKINAVKPPQIMGDEVTDENPTWTLRPMDDAIKYDTVVITNEKEHSKKTIEALQYEMKVQPDYYLDNGYHIFQAIAYDKIGNTSETSYYVTRKIGRPVASPITGSEKTSENFIEWSWQSQYYEGVREYIVEINGTEKNTIPASMDGFNEYILRHFQGRDISDGTYEIRVWAVNELGNRSYVYSSFLTRKGSKIKNIACEFFKYKGDYTNKLEAKILTDDIAIKHYQYEIFKNDNGQIVSVTGPMTSNQKQLPFLKPDGTKVELENGEYYFAFAGVNYIDEVTDYVMIPFIYRVSAPEKPFIYYLKSVKTTNPIFFVKETGNEMIAAIEIKVGDHNFEKIRNNAWRPNYALNLGTNNVVIRVTDYAGNQSEYGDFIEITSKGVNQFQEDYMADMNNPVIKLDFNLPQMTNFGHTNFKIEQEALGIEAIINVSNANNIELPLTISGNEVYPDGTYTFVVKLYDELTDSYDYIADYFAITLDSDKPLKPYFLNSGYSGLEYNRQYTKIRNPKWIWQTRDIVNLKEYIVDLYVLDEKENNYVEYGNGQFNNFSTALVGQFQSPDEFKDGVYKLTVKAIGLNNLSSESETFFMVIKNSLPKPPHFDLDKTVNRKYENRNTGVSWIWEDLNTGNDILVKYKVKINDEEFSDEIDGSINYYEEKRVLNDGPNTIMVIGCDKAGNWSTANKISANQYGDNYLSHTKIIDTVSPERISSDDIIVNILDSKSFEVLFNNSKKSEEYFLFELFTIDQNGEEILFVKGNTLPDGIEDIYYHDKKVEAGISVGALKDNLGYCEIRTTTEGDKTEKYLYFTNMLNNDYYLRVCGIDYAGNVSDEIVKEVKIQDLTKLKPTFILPKDVYTNNSTIVFQWILDEPNIIKWEYQLVTPYSNSKADLTNDAKWKSLEDNSFVINNIPKIIAGNNADGEYTFYVRAVFDETVTQEGTGLEQNKKSDIGSITVCLDREAPKGIYFTNKTYTADNSVLRWTWNYTGDGDTAAGVYVSFNPNLPLDEWEKITGATEYSSFKERTDGVYTLYVKTFDLAGNINENIFSNSITLDRIPPFKPIINGGSNIFTNVIPTVQWENDTNYFKYYWLVMTLEEFTKFKEVYDRLTIQENYTLTNYDWIYLFSNGDDDSQVNGELLQFKNRYNNPVTENFITINSSDNKNGISEEGEYVFLLSGHDENYNWSEEFEYQFITYDITVPDASKMKFISPAYVITEDRRPIWIWQVPSDVVKCSYALEKNGYNDGSMTGELYKKSDKSVELLEYSFRPEYNLTQGNYRLIVDCYDSAGNTVQISKSVIIEGSSTVFESQYMDIILPGINNRVRIKMNMYSDVYTITEIDINSNSALTYRRLSDVNSGFKIFEFGKTELKLDEEYEFNITSYNLTVK